jgi:hypothetical protein
MSTSLLDADRDTHIKIVVVALVTAIAISSLGIRAYRANLELVFSEGQPVVRALTVSPTAPPGGSQLAGSAAEPARDSI